MTTDRYVDILGSRVRYRVEGSGSPILLIHGIGASLEFWNWTTPALRDRHTTIAFDFPGFGGSDPRESAYSPSGAADTVVAFMDALGLRTTVIIGSSLGGAIATLAAGTAPERVSALVLVDPGGFTTGLNTLMRLETIPWVGEALLALGRRDPSLALSGVFAEQRRIPPELLDIVKANAARPGFGQAYLKALRVAAGPGGVRPAMVAQVHKAATRITAPTLIIWGGRDTILSPKQAEVAGRLIRGARVHVINGVGHVPYLESPDEFNTVLWAFLVNVTRPAEARIGL